MQWFFFVFAVRFEFGAYGLAYMLTMTGNKNNTVFPRWAPTVSREVVMKWFNWYVSQYTPNEIQHGLRLI